MINMFLGFLFVIPFLAVGIALGFLLDWWADR